MAVFGGVETCDVTVLHVDDFDGDLLVRQLVRLRSAAGKPASQFGHPRRHAHSVAFARARARPILHAQSHALILFPRRLRLFPRQFPLSNRRRITGGSPSGLLAHYRR